MQRKSIVFILSCCFYLTSLAQILETDTLRSFERYDTILYTQDAQLLMLRKVDTNITQFHQYNPILQQELAQQYLGNIGQANLPLVFAYQKNIGFQLGLETFNPYFFKQNEVKYFQSPHPFTEIGYVLGSEEEQVVKAQFGQNIGRLFNYHLDYRRITSPGLYQRQKAGYHNFAASTWFRTNGQNYNILAHYLLNTGDIEQNGGINFVDNEELFEDDIINKAIVPIALANASTIVKENNFFVQQYYDWGDYQKKALNDSTDFYQLIPQLRVGHHFTYNTFQYNYVDESPSLAFYNHAFLSSARTDDIVNTRQLKNEVFVTWLGRGVKKDSTKKVKKNNDAYLKASFEHQSIKQEQLASLTQLDSATFVRNDSSANLQTGLLKFAAQNNTKSRLHYQVFANYALFGYNNTDFSIGGKLKLRLSNKVGALVGDVVAKRLIPNQIATFYLGNHHQWKNANLSRINSLQFSGTYLNPSLKLALTYQNHTFDNYIVWEEDTANIVQPMQLAEVVNISQLRIQKNFVFGKSWHLDNQVVFQVSTSDKIRLPNVYTQHSFYFQGNLFQRAMLAKIGLDIFYNTNYRGYAYAPSISQFYLPQNNENLRYYPVIEPFITAKIKRVRLFGKIQQVNQGLFKNWQGYFAAIDHPMPDRTFKVGVSWYFYD